MLCFCSWTTSLTTREAGLFRHPNGRPHSINNGCSLWTRLGLLLEPRSSLINVLYHQSPCTGYPPSTLLLPSAVYVPCFPTTQSLCLVCPRERTLELPIFHLLKPPEKQEKHISSSDRFPLIPSAIIIITNRFKQIEAMEVCGDASSPFRILPQARLMAA